MASSPALEVAGFSVRHGRLEVVHNADITLEQREVRAIVGLNGAGKTSLLLALVGALRTASGAVRVNGIDVTNEPSWTCCSRGLVCVPAGRHLFSGLTVIDNLLVGGHVRRNKQAQKQTLDRVFSYFPILADKRHQRADELSGGQQQMLAIGRGVMAEPTVLLLDEPSEGLAPLIVSQVFDVIGELARTDGLAVLVAEQNSSVLKVCTTAMLMRNGVLSAPRRVEDTSEAELADYFFEASGQ